jgi:hypothetical protein
MNFSYIAFFISLLSGRVLGKNSKLNQYLGIEDWYSHSTYLLLIYLQNSSKADVNIISHSSPPLNTCHKIDKKTKVLYLVTGDGAAGGRFACMFCTVWILLRSGGELWCTNKRIIRLPS